MISCLGPVLASLFCFYEKEVSPSLQLLYSVLEKYLTGCIMCLGAAAPFILVTCVLPSQTNTGLLLFYLLFTLQELCK